MSYYTAQILVGSPEQHGEGISPKLTLSLLDDFKFGLNYYGVKQTDEGLKSTRRRLRHTVLLPPKHMAVNVVAVALAVSKSSVEIADLLSAAVGQRINNQFIDCNEPFAQDLQNRLIELTESFYDSRVMVTVNIFSGSSLLRCIEEFKRCKTQIEITTPHYHRYWSQWSNTMITSTSDK